MSDPDSSTVECVNCGRDARGEPRTLRLEERRELRVGLCADCFEEMLEEPWIEPVD